MAMKVDWDSVGMEMMGTGTNKMGAEAVVEAVAVAEARAVVEVYGAKGRNKEARRTSWKNLSHLLPIPVLDQYQYTR